MQCFLCRTDNAVKNRFSTLCRKKQKYAALAKENSTSYINSNNKRMMLQHCNNMDTTSESGVPIKNLRYCILYVSKYTNSTKRSANILSYWNIGGPILLMMQKRSNLRTDHIYEMELQ